MNRTRSSFDQKPPLAVSPRRLRPRRGRSAAIAAAPRTPPPASSPPEEAQRLRRSLVPEQSPLMTEYESISRDLRALTKRAKDEPTGFDALEAIALGVGDSNSLFERGRLYEVYSARRNERLKRKMEETFEGTPARHSVAVADSGRRKSTKRTEDLRRSAPESLLELRAPIVRSVLRSSTSENWKSSSVVLRSALKGTAEGDKRASLQSNRKK